MVPLAGPANEAVEFPAVHADVVSGDFPSASIWVRKRRAAVGSSIADELILFPSAEHDDLFYALQTMVEGAVEQRSSGVLIW